MSKPKRRPGTCPYCFTIGQLTKDHVIPQGLFGAAPLPGDVPKVFACESCNNNLKSKDDTYLRDLLVNDPENVAHPVVQELQPTFYRAVRANHSIYAREAAKILLVPHFTPSGRMTAINAQAKLDEQRIIRIFSTLVRGLYRYYFNDVLPLKTQFALRRLDTSASETIAMHQQILAELGARYVPVGDGKVFSSFHGVSFSRREVSIWYLCFYERILYLVATNCGTN